MYRCLKQRKELDFKNRVHFLPKCVYQKLKKQKYTKEEGYITKATSEEGREEKEKKRWKAWSKREESTKQE